MPSTKTMIVGAVVIVGVYVVYQMFFANSASVSQSVSATPSTQLPSDFLAI